MRVRSVIGVVLLLFSVSSFAQQVLSPDVVSELKSIVNMKQGDVVYVDFWASWCNPCRKSFPWMSEMQEKYRSKGLKILAINVDKERSLADDFLQKVPTNFQIYYDQEGKLAKEFKLMGMPSSFMLDDEGHIKIAHKGFFDKKLESYEQEIISLLNN